MPIQKASKDFKPHVALTGMNMNGGAANEHNVSCIMKANMTITDELALLTRLGKATPEVVEKASYRNLQKQLEAALKEKMYPSDDDYRWIWIQDFDDSTVIFESGEQSYSLGFTVSEMGIVTLSEEDAVEVLRQDVYVKTDGSELILKGAEEVEAEVVNPDDIVDSEVPEGEVIGTEPSDVDNEDKEDTMSDEKKVELTQEDIQKAVKDALDAEREAVALEKAKEETTLIVKGFGVAEDSMEILVKALVADKELAEVITKSFAAKDKAISDIKEEMVQVKAKFGSAEPEAETTEVAPVEKGKTPAEQMKANMQADLAAKTK